MDQYRRQNHHAAFVRFNAAGRKVSLKLEKGRQVELPLASLSGNDVDWIKEHVPEAMSNQERMQRHTEGRLGKITKIPATDSYPEAFVYYPSTLKAETPPPVIILFNSVGNGQHMVQKFRKACEANGWVALGLTTFKNSESKEHEAGLGKLWTSTNGSWREWPFLMRTACTWAAFQAERPVPLHIVSAGFRPSARGRGIVSMGGWLGGKDRLTCPTRMAVAIINGDKDGGANSAVSHDVKVLKRRQCAIKEFPFPGKHEMPPDENLVEVLKWMEEVSPQTSAQRLPSPAEKD